MNSKQETEMNGRIEEIEDRTLSRTAIVAGLAASITIGVGGPNPVVSLVAFVCMLVAFGSTLVLWLRTREGRLVGKWYLVREGENDP